MVPAMSDTRAETFEAFSRRILGAAESIPITRAGRSTVLAALSGKDQKAHVDRWWADGIDPMAATEPAPPVTPRAAMQAPIEPSGETFYGWVQRALVPGPGFEWARVEVPRHIVEALAKPDRVGRAIRKDTREVMTSEIMGELASWNLGNRARRPEGT